MTKTQLVIAAASALLDAEEYIAKGATARYLGTSLAWSDEFHRLGGLTATVRASWQTGASGPVVEVSGTDTAIAFALASAPLAA